MKEEKEKSNKLLKILLGIGACAGVVYVAGRCIPKFKTKVIEPIKGAAKEVVSDIEQAAMRDVEEHQNNKRREENKKFEERRSFSQYRQNDKRNKENRKFSKNNN